MGTHPIFESDFDCLTEMSDYEGLSRVVIVKKKKTEGLQFKLKYDVQRKGNIVSSSTAGGPAAAAGLATGDRLLVIKKTNVEAMKHDQVVDLIKKNIKKETIQFTVVSAEADPINPERDAAAADLGEKIFNLSRLNNSYGFSLSSKATGSGFEHTLKDIKAGGAAAKAGIKEKMVMLAINGQVCTSMDHKSVVNVVKTGGKTCIIRVRIAKPAEEAQPEPAEPVV